MQKPKRLTMKKLFVILALLITISPANAATRIHHRPIPRTVHMYHTDYNTKQLAVAGIFLVTVAIVVGIHASQYNQGQLRLVQF